MDSPGGGLGHLAGCCECGNEPPSCVKFWECFVVSCFE